MTDMSPDLSVSERLRPDEIAARARAAVAEGRTISHEQMTEWFDALEIEDGNDPDAPQTDRELNPGAYAERSAR